MRSAVAAAVFLAASPSLAVESMICENPRREYSVTLDGARFTVISEEGETRYRVLAVERTESRLVAAGMVGHDSGLGFAAQFAPNLKIEFYSDDAIVQTDVCRDG